MIRTLFVSMGELNKGARRPKDVPATKLRTIGVVGAGFMGAGIAYVTRAGRARGRADRPRPGSRREGQGLFAQAHLRPDHEGPRQDGGPRRAARPHHGVARTMPTSSDCDLVIEAVFEDPEGQGRGDRRRSRRRSGPDCIFALQHLDAADLAASPKATASPEQFIGIHFFSPVEKMMLVEIIMGEQTGDKALATALDYVRAIKKTPIVVNDARGFFANRCVGAYILEGPPHADRGRAAGDDRECGQAGRHAGRPALAQRRGRRRPRPARSSRRPRRSSAMPPSIPAQETLLVAPGRRRGRLGRKNRKGFYDYPGRGPKRLWPGLRDLQPRHLDAETLDMRRAEAAPPRDAGAGGRAHRRGRASSPIRARPMSARSSASASRPSRAARCPTSTSWARGISSICAGPCNPGTATGSPHPPSCARWRNRARPSMAGPRPERRPEPPPTKRSRPARPEPEG